MEYVLALVTLLFGFLFGRMFGKVEGSKLERGLNHAVYMGDKVTIIVGDKGMSSYMENGKIVTDTFTVGSETS